MYFCYKFIIAVRNGENAHAQGDHQLFDDHHLIGLLSKFAALCCTQLFLGSFDQFSTTSVF